MRSCNRVPNDQSASMLKAKWVTVLWLKIDVSIVSGWEVVECKNQRAMNRSSAGTRQAKKTAEFSPTRQTMVFWLSRSLSHILFRAESDICSVTARLNSLDLVWDSHWTRLAFSLSASIIMASPYEATDPAPANPTYCQRDLVLMFCHREDHLNSFSQDLLWYVRRPAPHLTRKCPDCRSIIGQSGAPLQICTTICTCTRPYHHDRIICQ
jgi:hypothetical protein